MRFLGVTETCDLGSLYLRLLAEGHDVVVSVSEPLASGTMANMVPRVEDWRGRLPWIREAGADGIILFEAVGFGALQDELRRGGFNVIGGSALGDRLENDRVWALDVLREIGLRIAPVEQFEDAKAAQDDLVARPRRCVVKRIASAGETFLGARDDGRDVAAWLGGGLMEGPLLLMDHIDGVETGVGAYFNGKHFLRPACLDWEHKHFFAGGLGELTGEMGTIATYTGSDRLFAVVLQPLEPMLRAAGHVGYVNINTIINADGVWPLEFTCRFGYPGFAVLEPLQGLTWGELFRAMVATDRPEFEVLPGYSACIVLTSPPFPYSRQDVDAAVNLPVEVDGVEPEHLHWGEVGIKNNQLVTAGLYGWTAVVTGFGSSVVEARDAAYRRASRVQAPNLRYRLDIGETLIAGELQLLSSWGWLNPVPLRRTESQMVL